MVYMLHYGVSLETNAGIHAARETLTTRDKRASSTDVNKQHSQAISI